MRARLLDLLALGVMVALALGIPVALCLAVGAMFARAV